jgi:hypothetical protein
MSEGPECQQKHTEYKAYAIADTIPSHTIKFSNADGHEVGMMDFSGNTLRFEGVAEESAVMFMTFLSEQFNDRLQKEYDKGFAAGKRFTSKTTKR